MLRYLSRRIMSTCVIPSSANCSHVARHLKSRNIPANCRLRLYSTKTKEDAEQKPVETKTESEEKPAAKTKPDASANMDTDEVIETLQLLQSENKKLSESNADLKDKYTRALAEIENVRLRTERRVDEAKQYSIQGFCKDLLEVGDILERAIESVPKEELKKDENKHLSDLFEGVQMTHTVLLKAYNKHGLVQVNPIGEIFDPNFHEAMFQVPDPEKEAGTIGHVAKIGYSLHNRPIRPAQVGVVKQP